MKKDNIIYRKNSRGGQSKMKTFKSGEYNKAMDYGWDLARKHEDKEFFIITEDNKCLRFNTSIIL